MIVFLTLIIAILVVLLIRSYNRNNSILREMKQLINTREAALDISNRVVNTRNPSDLYQYILESCLKLITKAKFGSILMFNSEGLLVAKASFGFNHDEISNFKLKLEESFIYMATEGKLDKTVIINRLEDIVLDKNMVNSGDKGFALRSEVASPLFINDELVGMLCIDGDEHDIFTEEDIYILDYMSRQISIVIHNQKMYGEILYLSRYDSMTNLLNRNSFDSETLRLLSSASTDVDSMHFVLIDFDGLKQANDTYGHNYGDEMIKSFSITIMKHLGRNDLCGRYGGDEFVAVFQGNYDFVVNKLKEIKEDFISSHASTGEDSFVPDFSYGIATFKESFGSLDTLYRLADIRMYETKNRKKSNY